jgi:hypothetical protein
MSSLGVDLKVSPDLGLFFSLNKEEDCLAQDLVDRLQCSKGMLFYDPNFGINLRNFLGSKQRPQDAFRAAADITSELKQDERVADCAASVVFDSASQSLTATIEVEALGGVTFTLVVLATTSLVKLLKVEP